MKKRLFLLLNILFVYIAAQAQFATQFSVLTPHYYPGEVYFTDGHHETYEELELPRAGKSKLGVKKNITDKNYSDIDAIDIVSINIWHKDFPDKVHTLYYVLSKKSMMQHEHQWGSPIYANDWGALFQCEMYYQIDKKTGDLDFVKFVGGNYPDTPTLYYLKRPDWDKAQLLIFDYQFIPKKKAAEFFKENEEIYNGIKSGKLKPNDIEYIMDNMSTK